MINQFGSETLIIGMKNYTSRIKAFKQHTYVVPFMECWEGQIKCDIPEYVTVQVKHDVTDCNLAKLVLSITDCYSSSKLNVMSKSEFMFMRIIKSSIIKI